MSRVVKGGDAATAETAAGATERARVVRGEVFDAKAEAAQIVAEAREDAERIRQQARAEGREEGWAEAAAALVAAQRAADKRMADVESELVALAVRIAEKILRRQLELEPDRVADIAKGALEDARGRGDLVIRVHPDDLAAVDKQRPALLARLPAAAELLFRGDASIERGGCVVESELGTVDARLDVQLAAIERTLREPDGV